MKLRPGYHFAVHPNNNNLHQVLVDDSGQVTASEVKPYTRSSLAVIVGSKMVAAKRSRGADAYLHIVDAEEFFEAVAYRQEADVE